MLAMKFGILHYAVGQKTFDDQLVAKAFRGPGFDQIRFVAATTVLLHHAHGFDYDTRIDPLFTYSGRFLHFGLLAVLVFFAISGFLVTPGLVRSRNLINYATNRVLRIFPALIVVVIASMLLLGPILTTMSPVSYFSDPKLYLYAKNILTLTTNDLPGVTSASGEPVVVNGALWTIHFEILSYGVLAIMSVLSLVRRSGVLIVFLAAYGVYVAMNFEPAVLASLPGRFATLISLFVYFAAGSALYMFRNWIPYSASLAVGAFALLMVALAFGFGAVFAPLCLPYITIFLGLSVLPGHSLLKRDLSYGIYLIHAPVLVAFGLFYPALRPWWLVAMVAFVIVLVLSYLSSRFIESPALARKKAVFGWLSDHFSRALAFQASP
jgi:peptidoglycan/LPS O-acetylase OafA/YrhL